MSTYFDENRHARDAAGRFAPTAASEAAVSLSPHPDSGSDAALLIEREAHREYRSNTMDKHGACPRHVVGGHDVANTPLDRLPRHVQEELAVQRVNGTSPLNARPRRSWPRQGRVPNLVARRVAEHEAHGGSVSVSPDGAVRWLDKNGQPGCDEGGDPDGRACGWDADGTPDLWSHRGRVVPRARLMSLGAVFCERLPDGGQHEFLVDHSEVVIEHVYTDAEGRMHNPVGPCVATDDMVEFAVHGRRPQDGPGRVHSDGSVQFLDDLSLERHPDVLPVGVHRVGRDYQLDGVDPDGEVDLAERFGDPWVYADRTT